MNQGRTATGTVVSRWRYPVKSMLGEELNSSYITERGLIGGSHVCSNRSENWQSG